jgi:hypothetical protein
MSQKGVWGIAVYGKKTDFFHLFPPQSHTQHVLTTLRRTITKELVMSQDCVVFWVLI